MADDAAKNEQPLLEDNALDDDAQIVMSESRSMASRLFFVLLFIIAVGALGLSGYVYWLLEEHSKSATALGTELRGLVEENDSDTAIADLQKQLQVQSALSKEFETQLTESKAETRKMLTQLSQSVADTKKNISTEIVPKDYLLSELEHLLILANNNVRIDGDVKTAISALKAVDNRLMQAEGNDLLILREHVINDLSSLQSINDVDTKGLSLYLANMAANTEALPVVNIFSEADKTEQAIEERGTDFESISEFASALWIDIKSMVLVTPDVNQSEAVMLRGESYFLKHNLRLELLTARIAVLKKDTDNFQASIEQSMKWLNKYFDSADAAVKTMQTELEGMQNIDLSPELPDISSSLENLRAIVRERGNNSAIGISE